MRLCFEACNEDGVSGGIFDIGRLYLSNQRRILREESSIPNGVLLRTALRRRSPELTEESWGNLFIRRSACVPLPTPGAPTKMTRAARLKSFMAISGQEGSAERRVGGPESR